MLSVQNEKKLVVLGTGGTIAGIASKPSDNIGYTAAQVGVAALLDAVPGLTAVLAGCQLRSEQVAQVDSKDMDFDIWKKLAQRVHHHLSQTDVQGIVVTHGTDTLEETAYFLQAVLPPSLLNGKPVVLTCAMRPASALVPDGPQNLLDAVTVALAAGAHGVVVVCAGAVHTAQDVQKNHTYRLDAFSSGDAGVMAYVEEGQVKLLRNWPVALDTYASAAIKIVVNGAVWPRVEVVMSYAGCGGQLVEALLRPSADVTPVCGLVVAGTGNGTLHRDMEAALRRAQAQGVSVVRATRCPNGRIIPAESSEFPHSRGLSPVKARIALMLELMHSS